MLLLQIVPLQLQTVPVLLTALRAGGASRPLFIAELLQKRVRIFEDIFCLARRTQPCCRGQGGWRCKAENRPKSRLEFGAVELYSRWDLHQSI